MLYAGTDAKVFIKLFGTQQESDEIELEDKSLKKFESGRYKMVKVNKIERIADHINQPSFVSSTPVRYLRKRMKTKPTE